MLTARRWLSLPLAVFLAAVWMSAAGFGVMLGRAAMLALAEVALWSEVHELTLASAEPPAAPVREAAFSGLVGGYLGGVALWLLTGVPGAPLMTGFLGAAGAALARGVEPRAALVAAFSLPGRGARSTFVLGLFLVAVALGLVPPPGAGAGLAAGWS